MSPIRLGGKTQRQGAPFADAGLDDALVTVTRSGMLQFCADIAESVRDAGAVIITVPVLDGSGGMEVLEEIAATVTAVVAAHCVLIIKSTVPPGTCRKLQNAYKLSIVANPEFLRQGHGFEDFMSPARIVVGGDNESALCVVRTVYASLIASGTQYIETDSVSAEIAKLASNMFLAGRVALINETADLCEAAGGNIDDVVCVIAADKRIGGDYLRASAGFGGFCLPKDGRLLAEAADANEVSMPAAGAIYISNRRRIKRIAEHIIMLAPENPVITFWGLAFKPGADSICDSPAVEMMRILHASCRCRLQAYDSLVDIEMLRKTFPAAVFFDESVAALSGADILVVITGNKEFSQVPPAVILKEMQGKLILDYAGVFDYRSFQKLDITLHTVGMSFPVP